MAEKYRGAVESKRIRSRPDIPCKFVMCKRAGNCRFGESVPTLILRMNCLNGTVIQTWNLLLQVSVRNVKLNDFINGG